MTWQLLLLVLAPEDATFTAYDPVHLFDFLLLFVTVKGVATG